MIDLKPIFHNLEFKEFNKKFESYYKKFSPHKNKVSLNKYFGEGIGKANTLKYLYKDGMIKKSADFSGIYVFIKNDIPFYVGISQHVIERLIQHVKGKNHFTSSLCYRLGANYHLVKMGEPHQGGRAGLKFEEFGEPAKKELMKCDVAFFQIDDHLELYLF